MDRNFARAPICTIARLALMRCTESSTSGGMGWPLGSGNTVPYTPLQPTPRRGMREWAFTLRCATLHPRFLGPRITLVSVHSLQLPERHWSRGDVALITAYKVCHGPVKLRGCPVEMQIHFVSIRRTTPCVVSLPLGMKTACSAHVCYVHCYILVSYPCANSCIYSLFSSKPS